MRARDKLKVTAELIPRYNKRWVYIALREGTRAYDERRFVPSFEDHFLIICAYAWCEILKYPTIDPIPMLQNFFTRATEMAGRVARKEIDYDAAWQELRQEFKIPSRES